MGQWSRFAPLRPVGIRVAAMLPISRAIPWRTCGLTLFALAGIAIAAGSMVDDQQLPRIATPQEPVVVSSACEQADRASLPRLVRLLERNRPSDVIVLERAIHALNIARRHCQYGWTERGLEDYRWLDGWLIDHQ